MAARPGGLARGECDACLRHLPARRAYRRGPVHIGRYSLSTLVRPLGSCLRWGTREKPRACEDETMNEQNGERRKEIARRVEYWRRRRGLTRQEWQPWPPRSNATT